MKIYRLHFYQISTPTRGVVIRTEHSSATAHLLFFSLGLECGAASVENYEILLRFKIKNKLELLNEFLYEVIFCNIAKEK